ncbi:MAG: excinuclease ABC subunit UvrC [Chlamydiales bacterium]|nr:excinuclease ABC subunit UvrC [Chlamydiales bacterium]
MDFDVQQLKRFPSLPGVYLMKNAAGKILYVGKAKNLRSRVKQYFGARGDGREMVPYLTAQVAEIDTIVVASEKEALILENNLIKKHRPKYNALLKDDKTYFSLVINHKHRWPMVRVARFKGKPPPGNLYFGPYAYGHAARQTLELLRSLFPLRQCSDRELMSRTRPCILYDMKRCVAPCVEMCTKEEYDALVKTVVDFLRGKEVGIRKELKAQMQKAIDALEYEKADQIYQTLQYIERTLEKQQVEKAGTADLDVIGIFRQADSVVVAQLFFREGKLIGSNDHLFMHNAQEDEELLSSFLLQQYGDQKELPDEIVLPLDVGKALESLLNLKLTAAKRGNKRALLEMARVNAEAKFRRKANIREQTLLEMEEMLQLTNYPERIECFDNSNISGTEPVSAMVVFTEGEKDPRSYRKYKIKTAAASDDYGMLKEVLTRRYRRAKEEKNLPDLLIIDGGKGHLNVALDALSSLDVSTVDVIGVAKEKGRHDRGMTAEQIFLQGEKEPLILKPNSPILFLLQQIRDEAHRFAITFQRLRRGKKSMASTLDSLPGIGPVKKQRLLSRFGSLKRILEASEEEWREVKGITKKDILTLRSARPPAADHE